MNILTALEDDHFYREEPSGHWRVPIRGGGWAIVTTYCAPEPYVIRGWEEGHQHSLSWTADGSLMSDGRDHVGDLVLKHPRVMLTLEARIEKVISEMARGRCEHCRTPAVGLSPGMAECSCARQCRWTPPTAREQAVAVIYAVWGAEPRDSELDPASLVDIEIAIDDNDGRNKLLGSDDAEQGMKP